MDFQKEMIVDFRKHQREHPPIHIDGTVVERVESYVPRRTHHGQTEMVHTHKQHGEEGAAAPLQTQEADEIRLVTKNSQTFTDAQLRASCRAVSPPGTAAAPPINGRLSRG